MYETPTGVLASHLQTLAFLAHFTVTTDSCYTHTHALNHQPRLISLRYIRPRYYTLPWGRHVVWQTAGSCVETTSPLTSASGRTMALYYSGLFNVHLAWKAERYTSTLVVHRWLVSRSLFALAFVGSATIATTPTSRVLFVPTTRPPRWPQFRDSYLLEHRNIQLAVAANPVSLRAKQLVCLNTIDLLTSIHPTCSKG